jgi:signal peptidase I
MSVAEQSTNIKAGQDKKSGGIGETVKVIVQALLIALVFRTFFYHPFNIPSGSMIPTLLIGDFLFVSKFSYGYSRFSFPIELPFLDGRYWDDEPERGDIAVFRLPRDTKTDYIKRVIGLPGDKIKMTDGVLSINGKAVKRERVADYIGENAFGRQSSVRRYKETLPNGVSFFTLDLNENSAKDTTGVYEVPPGHYFMMGDNRDNSTDSRFLQNVGFVPAENLVGRAEVIFFSVDEEAAAWAFWRWPWTLRFDRFFTGL